jgi:hypothetical protein
MGNIREWVAATTVVQPSPKQADDTCAVDRVNAYDIEKIVLGLPIGPFPGEAGEGGKLGTTQGAKKWGEGVYSPGLSGFIIDSYFRRLSLNESFIQNLLFTSI